jgi:hypothetical protein
MVVRLPMTILALATCIQDAYSFAVHMTQKHLFATNVISNLLPRATSSSVLIIYDIVHKATRSRNSFEQVERSVGVSFFIVLFTI